MDISRAKSLLGWEPEISLDQGVRNVVEWYKENKSSTDGRYNVFKEK